MAPSDRRRRLGPPSTAWLLVVLVTCVYGLTTSGYLASTDIEQELDVAVHIVRDGTFETDVAPVVPGGGAVLGPDGRAYSAHNVGMTVLFLPVAALAVALGLDVAAREALASVVVPAFTVLTVLLLHVAFRQLGHDRRTSALAALVAAFATLLWPYAHVSFDVVPAGALLLASVLAARRGRVGSARWLVASGAAMAAGFLVRISSALAAPLVLAYVVAAPGDVATRVRRGVAWGAPALLGPVLTAAYNQARFGDALDTGHAGDPQTALVTPLLEGLAGLLVSPGKGILLFSPPLLLCLWGARRLWRRDAALAALVGAISVVWFTYHALLRAWSGDEAWGPRFLVTLLPLLLVALPDGIEAARRVARGGLVAVVVALGVALQLLGVSLSYVGVMREAGVVPYAEGFYWTPTDSQIAHQARKLRQALRTGHPYDQVWTGLGPAGLGAPRVDVWWARTGGSTTGRVLTASGIAIGVGGAAVSGVLLARRLRPDPGPSDPSRPGPPSNPVRTSGGRVA